MTNQETKPAMVGEQEPVLVVQHGEICYKSRDDDQSYGMWCPVTPDSNHGLINGAKLYTAAPVAQQPQPTCKTCGRRLDDPAVIHGPNGCCPAQQPQSDDYKGWYCAHCQRGVDGSEVTYHEQHTVCGRVITDDLPPKQPQAEAVPSDVVRDAERYRWLRNESWAGYNTGKGTPSVYTVDGAGNRRMMLAEEAMDDAIDAAIAAQGAKT